MSLLLFEDSPTQGEIYNYCMGPPNSIGVGGMLLSETKKECPPSNIELDLPPKTPESLNLTPDPPSMRAILTGKVILALKARRKVRKSFIEAMCEIINRNYAPIMGLPSLSLELAAICTKMIPLEREETKTENTENRENRGNGLIESEYKLLKDPNAEVLMPLLLRAEETERICKQLVISLPLFGEISGVPWSGIGGALLDGRKGRMSEWMNACFMELSLDSTMPLDKDKLSLFTLWLKKIILGIRDIGEVADRIGKGVKDMLADDLSVVISYAEGEQFMGIGYPDILLSAMQIIKYLIQIIADCISIDCIIPSAKSEAIKEKIVEIKVTYKTIQTMEVIDTNTGVQQGFKINALIKELLAILYELSLDILANGLISIREAKTKIQEEEKKQEDKGTKKKKNKQKRVPLARRIEEIYNFYREEIPNFELEKIEEIRKSLGEFGNIRDSEYFNSIEMYLEVRNTTRRIQKVAKGTRDFEPWQMCIRSEAIMKIREIFEKHGAVEIETPVFELREVLMGKYGEESKLIYDLAEQGGERLSLRYDLTVPFARYMATKNVQSIKRFQIGKVYRRENTQISKGRYREFMQLDFDIAGGNYGKMLPDADTVKIFSELLLVLDVGEFKIKLSNRALLDAMISIAGCEKGKFKTICSAVDKLDKVEWKEVREELVNLKGISPTSVDILGEMVNNSGPPMEILSKLKLHPNFLGNSQAMEVLAEMELLFTYLEAMNCLQYCVFDLSLARGLDYYTGLILEAVLVGEGNLKLGSVAGGGRYDGLIGMFSAKPIPAVGASLGIERIFAILEDKYKTSVPVIKTKVLVCTVGKGMNVHKLKIATELWDAHIPAEYLYFDNPNTKKHNDYAIVGGTPRIPFMVWIGGDEVAQNVVKLKITATQVQETVNRADIIPRLKVLMEE